jgi:predicted glycosyltransferase
MRIWMDMANSPHPMLLGPVADELESQGHEVWVTARDHAQTVDLTLERWPSATVIGTESPSSRASKLKALMGRVRRLQYEASRRAPDVALSLNSYAQVVAARLARVPCVTLMDYEYQPANHVSFRLAQQVVIPKAFPLGRARRYGVRSASRLRQFEGYKEELYLDRVAAGGRDGWLPGSENGKVRCLMRPPPHGAMYHRSGNTRFDDLLARISAREDMEALVLPRFAAQRESYRRLPGIRVAEETVDGLRALRAADAFIGAGGTMCREAALLGVPAYTMFSGRMAAVDAQLIQDGRLYDLRNTDLRLESLSKRTRQEASEHEQRLRVRAGQLRSWLVNLIGETASGRAR